VSHTFALDKSCPETGARAGLITTSRGAVPTPAFLPVGSQAAVKALGPDEVRAAGASIILANTYHLHLRPGVGVIEKVGGLHRFMSWPGPILTDSGGYQVFSLARLCRTADEGVTFRSHVDGSEHFLTPEMVIQLQERLGSDIIMPLDECPPYCQEPELIREAVRRTHVWAERSRLARRRDDQALYGIVQGGAFPELRRQSAEFLASLGFDGYAIGGVSLGEPKQVMFSTIEETVGWLPEDRPRYLMGVGSPEDILEAVARGVDLFDSALPTRTARNGALFTASGRRNIQNACYRDRDEPLDRDCGCYTCRHFSAAYLHHLFRSRELLAYRLATIHNLTFVLGLMRRIREAILDGRFAALKRAFLAEYRTTDEETRLVQKQKWLSSRTEPESLAPFV